MTRGKYHTIVADPLPMSPALSGADVVGGAPDCPSPTTGSAPESSLACQSQWVSSALSEPDVQPVLAHEVGTDLNPSGSESAKVAAMRYRTIVADPPWPQPDSGARTQSTAGNWRGKWLGYVSEIPYATMTLDEIRALPVADLAERDAHLYLWTTNRFLEDAYSVARAWGFRFSTLLAWCKAPMGIGLGGAYTITTEYVLFCRRGSLAPLQRADSTWWQFKRPYNANGAPAHSRKPDGFLDIVEQVSPSPRLEMFARRQRLGWDTWGDEALEHVSLNPTAEAV